MNRHEELALLTTIEKAVKSRLADIKDELKGELMNLEREYGVDRIAIKIGEEKVGDVSITRALPTVELKAGCDDAIHKLDEYGLVEMVPKKGWQNEFFVLGDEYTVVDSDGVVCDWLVAVPGYVKGTMVKVDAKKVIPYLANDYLAEGAVKSLLLVSGE